MDIDEVPVTKDTGFWVSALGGFGETTAQGSLTSYDHKFRSALLGASTGSPYDDTGLFGLFAGYVGGNVITQAGASELRVDILFGGAYWKRDFISHRVNFALAGGASDNQSTRHVSGMAADGDYKSWFIAPSLTIAVPIEAFHVPFNISGRISYVGVFNEGYTETGAAPWLLTVDSRHTRIVLMCAARSACHNSFCRIMVVIPI